jgi:hypothetical protein
LLPGHVLDVNDQRDLPMLWLACFFSFGLGIAGEKSVLTNGDPDLDEGLILAYDDLKWSVTSLAFSESGRWLAAAQLDRSITVFDTVNAVSAGRLEGNQEARPLRFVRFVGDNELWGVTEDGMLCLFKLTDVGKPIGPRMWPLGKGKVAAFQIKKMRSC